MPCLIMDVNREQLAAKLHALGVPESFYSLDGGNPHNKLCIEQGAAGWTVYFSERGSRWSEEHFKSEDAACQRFLERCQRMTRTSADK